MLFAPLIALYKMKGKYQLKIVKLIFTQVLNIMGMDEKEILEKMSSKITDNLKITGRWGLRKLYKALKSFKNTLDNVAHFNPEIIAMYFEYGKNLHHFTSLDNIQRFLRICVDASKLADEVFEIVAHLLEPEDYKTQKDAFIVDTMTALDDNRTNTDELRQKFLDEKREYLSANKAEAQEAIEKNKIFVVGLFSNIAKNNKHLKKGCDKLIGLIKEVDVVQDFFFLDKQVSNSEVVVSNNTGTSNRPNRTTSSNLGMALATALINSANSSKTSSESGDNDMSNQVADLKAQLAAMKRKQ